MNATLPTIQEIEEAISIPTERWVGNCYGVATALVESGLVEGTPRYGLYWGEIADSARVFGGRSITHHGWIEHDDGTITDPTRWVFEDVEPYLWHGEATEEYDMGGNKLRMATIGDTPLFDPEAQAKDIPDDSMITLGLEHIMGEALDPDMKKITIEQLHWLAHLSPEALGPPAKPIYTWLNEIKLKGLIPIDNWIYVMGGPK